MSQGLQTGHLWQWVAAKLDAVKGYLYHLNLPLPPEQIKLESIVQTVLSRASAFIYANAVGLILTIKATLWGTVMVPAAVIPLVGSAIIWGQPPPTCSSPAMWGRAWALSSGAGCW